MDFSRNEKVERLSCFAKQMLSRKFLKKERSNCFKGQFQQKKAHQFLQQKVSKSDRMNVSWFRLVHFIEYTWLWRYLPDITLKWLLISVWIFSYFSSSFPSVWAPRVSSNVLNLRKNWRKHFIQRKNCKHLAKKSWCFDARKKRNSLLFWIY